MTLIFMDGFDHYGATDLAKKWTSVGSGIAALSASYARQQPGQGLLMAQANVAPLIKSFGSNRAGLVVGFAWQSTAVASRILCTILDGGTEQCSIRINSSGVITVNQGSTVKATGSTVLSANTWYYVEAKLTVHGSTGVAEVHLNGATEIASTSSLDLTGTANNYWNALMLGIQNSVNGVGQWDDLYLLDTAAGPNDDFLGPSRIHTLLPAGPGNYAQWTGNLADNFINVSEVFADGDSTFNQDATAGHKDTFDMQDPPTGTIHALQHVMYVRQDAGAQRTVRPIARISGTDYNGASLATSSSYLMHCDPEDESPATSAAWTDSEVAGAEFGYEMVS